MQPLLKSRLSGLRAASGGESFDPLSREAVAGAPRHRLLPKPYGCEGLFGIEVAPDPNRLAVLELDYGGKGRRGLDSALLTTRDPAADCDNSIAEIPDLRELDLELAESLVQVAKHLADAIVSPMHRRFPSQRSQNRGLPLHVSVEFLQHRFDISSVVRVRKAFESLDVLLGHRLLLCQRRRRNWRFGVVDVFLLRSTAIRILHTARARWRLRQRSACLRLLPCSVRKVMVMDAVDELYNSLLS
jgi:hypothetical protein